MILWHLLYRGILRYFLGFYACSVTFWSSKLFQNSCFTEWLIRKRFAEHKFLWGNNTPQTRNFPYAKEINQRLAYLKDELICVASMWKKNLTFCSISFGYAKEARDFELNEFSPLEESCLLIIRTCLLCAGSELTVPQEMSIRQCHLER